MGLAPILSVDEERILARTPWFARFLGLFSFDRSVTVDRRHRRVTVSTTRVWLWREIRVVDFDRVSRIIFTGQGIPSLLFWRHLSLRDSDGYETAFFLISLGLKDPAGDLALFTVWEGQLRDSDWLDRLAGAPMLETRVGDEAALRIVELLHDFLSVPIARH